MMSRRELGEKALAAFGVAVSADLGGRAVATSVIPEAAGYTEPAAGPRGLFVLKVPDDVSQEACVRIRERWERLYGEHGKLVVLPHACEFTSIQTPGQCKYWIEWDALGYTTKFGCQTLEEVREFVRTKGFSILN